MITNKFWEKSVMRIKKPAQEELDNYEERSEYCKEASRERIWLANYRAVVNKYSNCAVNFSDEYKKRKENYLNKFVYFEQNTFNNLDKNRHGWHNFIFTEKEIENKIIEIEKVA
jgi:hypothetical protein